MVLDRARLDDAGPADDHGRTIAAFPGFALLAFEGRDAAVGVSRESPHVFSEGNAHKTVFDLLYDIVRVLGTGDEQMSTSIC